MFPTCLGIDDFDHHPFVATHENGADRTLAILKYLPITGNAIVGVGSGFLLNCAAVKGTLVRPSEHSGVITHIVVIDRGLRVEHFWQQMVQIIQKCSTREEVKKELYMLLKQEKKRYFSGGLQSTTSLAHLEIQLIDQEITEGKSWLSNDSRFLRIKQIFDANRFLFIGADLFDPSAATALVTFFQEKEIKIDLFYASDVDYYSENSSQGTAYNLFLNTLLHKGVPFIETDYGDYYNGDAIQKISRKTEVLGCSPMIHLKDVAPHSKQSLPYRNFALSLVAIASIAACCLLFTKF